MPLDQPHLVFMTNWDGQPLTYAPQGFSDHPTYVVGTNIPWARYDRSDGGGP